MTSKIASSRNPYPFPKLQNDEDFAGSHQMPKSPFSEPAHIAQLKDPFNRLNSTKTLASSRREVFHYDPQAPHDSLDFIVKAKYDHHKELLRSRNETLIQPETVEQDHGRRLKNRNPEMPKKALNLNHPLVIVQQEKKESIDTISNAIESPHSAATNGGYSRKHDGGFFCL